MVFGRIIVRAPQLLATSNGFIPPHVLALEKSGGSLRSLLIPSSPFAGSPSEPKTNLRISNDCSSSFAAFSAQPSSYPDPPVEDDGESNESGGRMSRFLRPLARPFLTQTGLAFGAGLIVYVSAEGVVSMLNSVLGLSIWSAASFSFAAGFSTASLGGSMIAYYNRHAALRPEPLYRLTLQRVIGSSSANSVLGGGITVPPRGSFKAYSIGDDGFASRSLRSALPWAFAPRTLSMVFKVRGNTDSGIVSVQAKKVRGGVNLESLTLENLRTGEVTALRGKAVRPIAISGLRGWD